LSDTQSTSLKYEPSSQVDYTNSVQLAVAGLGLCLVGRALNIFPLAFITNQVPHNPFARALFRCNVDEFVPGSKNVNFENERSGRLRG